jgi:N6-adenosine-specific RNA methylase IME4
MAADITRAQATERAANEAYGKLKSEVFMAGFSFERAQATLLGLLKDGWRACGPGFDDVNVFIASIKLDKFRIMVEQRNELVAEIKRLQPKVSNRAIAKALGVHGTTISRPAANAAPGTPQAARGKSPSGPAAANAAPAVSGRRAAQIIQLRERPDLKKERRAERERELVEKTRAAAAKLGTKFYNVIYADPPWRFEPYSRDTGMDRAADNHYPTMPLEEIAAMKVPAAPDCVLFLWATFPMLREAFAVMAAWGFDYKTAFVWQKTLRGTGFWVIDDGEALLIGTKGNVPAPAPGEQYTRVHKIAQGEHSAKPGLFAEMIETMFPNADRLEMFAREQRAGWTCWGNEA